MDRFGEFLVEAGVITPAQLLDALQFQSNAAQNLSLMAFTEDVITDQDVERVIARRLETGETFEEALLALRVLSPERIEELRHLRTEFRIPLGEVLLRRGVFDERQLKDSLQRYERTKSNPEREESALTESLRIIPAFQRLSADGVRQLARAAKSLRFEPGEAIYREGDETNDAFIIESGTVRLWMGHEAEPTEIGTLRSGDDFGLNAILGREPRLESAQALTRTRVWRLHLREVKVIMQAEPQAFAELALETSRQLQALVRSIKDRARAFETNLYTIFFETSSVSRELIGALLHSLAKRLPGGTVQVLHNHPESEIAEYPGSDYSGRSDPAGGPAPATMFSLALPQIAADREFHRFLSWLHQETRSVDALVFLVFSPRSGGDGQGRDVLRELLFQNSNRTLVFTDEGRVAYAGELDAGRDRVYLVHSHDARENHERYQALLGDCGRALAPITFKTDRLDDSADAAVLALLGREVAIVFGGGGAKSAAQVGVLQALAAANIPLQVAAGSSSGAIVAGLWATGLTPDEMAEIYIEHSVRKPHRFPDWWIPRRGALAKGATMERFLKILFGRARTFDTRRPFLPVAVDLTRGNDVIVQGCEIWEAVYGSQTIPGMIPLIHYNGMYLADGALANNIPASQARRYGAETVIAVNISPTPDATTFDPRSVASNMLRSVEVMMHQTTRRSYEFCDLEIRPEVFEYGLMDFKHAERFMELGREAARACLPELRLLLAERKWRAPL